MWPSNQSFCPQMMVTGAKAGKEWKGRTKASEEQKDGEESDDTGIVF